jgi:hypothetical protein
LTDYTNCVYSAFDAIYGSGGRYFVLLNVTPLCLTPLYANYTVNGSGPNHYWPDMPSNKTQIADIMHEYVTTLNSVYRYRMPFELLVAKRHPRAEFAPFDTWQLISDIYDNPTGCLNGSAPANVTGFVHHCNLTGQACVDEDGGKSPDSFLWYDELHPRHVDLLFHSTWKFVLLPICHSEQTDWIIAKELVDVLGGMSNYATYSSS